MTITGVTFNPAGLGLANRSPPAPTSSTTFDQSVLTELNTASITLRSQASAFGANLSIVQIRQDFNKNLINVLQTGSSALTLADPTRKRPTARRCRPASRSRPPRCRSPTSRSRAFFSCCADRDETSDKRERRGFGPAVFFWCQAGAAPPRLVRGRCADEKSGEAKPRRRNDLSLNCRHQNQRNSCSTLCCDWLASDSADTAIDWRVDSAWLLAASSLDRPASGWTNRSAAH